jgi:hypothetical protein
MHLSYWLENVKRGDSSEGLGVDGRVILEWTLRKYGEELWTGCI